LRTLEIGENRAHTGWITLPNFDLDRMRSGLAFKANLDPV